MRVWPYKKRTHAHVGNQAIRRAARDILRGRAAPMLFADLYGEISKNIAGASYSLVAVALHTSSEFKSHGKRVGWSYIGAPMSREEFIDGKAKEMRWERFRTKAGFQSSKAALLALRCACRDSECRGWKLVAPHEVAEHLRLYGHLETHETNLAVFPNA